MDAIALYNLAKGFINKVKNEKPSVAEESDVAICLIVLDDQKVISGITGMGVHEGNIISYPAECVAISAMFASGEFMAKQMIVVSMADNSITVPCVECLDMLMLLNTENDGCEIFIAEDRSATVSELLSADDDDEEEPEQDAEPSAAVNYFSGFDDAAPSDGTAAAAFDSGFDDSYAAPQHEPVKTPVDTELGAPADFASDVTLDESNPFNAQTDAATPTKSLNPSPEAKTEQEAVAKEEPDKDVSKEDLVKQAKKRKKIAKANFNFFKKKGM